MIVQSLFKNKPYVFEVEKDSFEDNYEIIYGIFDEIGMKKPDEVHFLAANYNYDAYKVKCEDKYYFVKYSLDSKNKSLAYEFDIIKKLKTPTIATPIAQDSFTFGDIIHYSVYEFQFAENIKQYGLGLIIENLDNFIYSYSFLQNRYKPKKTFNNYIEDFLNNSNLDFLIDESLSAIKKHSNLEIIKKIIDDIKKEIMILARKPLFEQKDFCHGNLKPSNILFRNGFFKFIDFEESFCGHRFLDIAHLCLHSFLPDEKQIEIAKKIYSNFSNEDLSNYRHCYALMLRIVFLNCFLDLIKEVFVLDSSRPIKIFFLVERFIKNEKSFLFIPSVRENHKFLHDMFYNTIIGTDEFQQPSQATSSDE
jgi:serine/threonine protein kinase